MIMVYDDPMAQFKYYTTSLTTTTKLVAVKGCLTATPAVILEVSTYI